MFLKEFIYEEKMTQQEFCDKAGITLQTLNRLMKGSFRPKIDTWLSIKRIVGDKVNEYELKSPSYLPRRRINKKKVYS